MLGGVPRLGSLGLGGAPPGVFGTWGCPYGVLGLGASHSSLERPPRSVLDPLGASLAFSSTRGSLLIDILCACLIEPTVLLFSHRFVKEKVRTGSEKKLVMVQTGMVCGSCGS